ncbi:OmpH family outer membrane protein [Dinoroseobacter sp. PD6]|uniref:OmpH family outer membrane protein n=1 Tax=Dinoroseobacter sp. PD6 TaxID=3028384 RepID=UPI00237C2BEE|nr:OmpH family outer membrane protein [Dinoroseobacter sp. PD6]MDD9715668.1 OmpH family outer membrane protein [Dinoroseobacter sp. PD6]
MRGWRLWRAVALALCLLAGAGTVAGAQERIQSSILVIEQDRLFLETWLGAQLIEDVDAQSRALALENREIERTLIEEEQALTTSRPTMTPEAFREAADAFDARVNRIRSAQDAKSQALIEQREQARAQFLELVLPILGGLLSDYGAYVFLDPRQVFLSDDRINVTDEAISRIDATFTEPGEAEAQTPPTPE